MKSPAEASSASTTRTPLIVAEPAPSLVTETHWPAPIVFAAWVGKTGVLAPGRAPDGVENGPGEPISPAALRKAPSTPSLLTTEIGGGGFVVPPIPAVLSKDEPEVAPPKA